ADLIRLVPRPAGELAAEHPWLLPDPEWHDRQAVWAERDAEWSAAAFHHARVLAGRPWDAAAHLRRGLALAELGRHDEAVGHYLHALALDPRGLAWPRDPGAASRGRRAADAGDWPRAAAAYRAAAHQPRASR